MFNFKAQKLTRKLLILGILFGCLVLLALPQGIRADNCTDCDWAYNGAIQQCRANYSQCQVNYSVSYCDAIYMACWENAVDTYTSCLQSCGSEYDPGRGSGGDPAQRNSCVRSCDDVYWVCFENGGASTGTYQSCMASGGMVDDCCYAERSICLSGCQ